MAMLVQVWIYLELAIEQVMEGRLAAPDPLAHDQYFFVTAWKVRGGNDWLDIGVVLAVPAGRGQAFGPFLAGESMIPSF
jgi:hypothetical protein